MVCAETSKMYLKGLNALISVLGLGLVGAGVYGLVELREELEAVSVYAPWSPLVLGGAIFLVGLLGCWGASAQNKGALILYWVLMTVCTLAVLFIGIFFMLNVGYLDDVKVFNSAELISDAKSDINDFIMAVFTTCCGAAVPACANSTATACINDVNFYNNQDIPEELCSALGHVSGDTAVIEECAGGASAFKAFFVDYVEDNVLPIGIVLIVLSVLLLLADVFTCCLICTNRIDYDKEYRARVQQQQAGALSGTNPQGIKYT